MILENAMLAVIPAQETAFETAMEQAKSII